MTDPKTEDFRYRICQWLNLVEPCDLNPEIPTAYNVEGFKRNIRNAYIQNGNRAWRLLLSTLVLVAATLYFISTLVIECSQLIANSNFFDLGLAGALLVGATVFPNVITTVSPPSGLPIRTQLLIRIQHDSVALGLLFGTPAWAVEKCSIALWVIYGLILIIIVAWQFRNE